MTDESARERTIFDRILDGEIPCHKVYEDEHVLAFLDIFPLSEGHTLVIPKERKAHLHELSDEQSARSAACSRASRAR
jgi:histidine triad (HIT) family protein